MHHSSFEGLSHFPIVGPPKYSITMAPPQTSEGVQMDLGHVIFTALVALGFNPMSIEQKERKPINEQIFKRMNKKVGDHILHFLFTCINCQQAAEAFRDCWPIYDKKTEAQFRSVVFEWFKALNQSEELNLKPVPVVSKAVVTPTSNKFLPTVYTLSRFALHSQITHLDPSVRLVFFPTLATKQNQRRKAMQLILKSKHHHAFQYITAVDRRNKLLQLYRDKAKELIDKYRALVKTRENVQKEVDQHLSTSNFISTSMKSILATAPFDQFCEELERSIQLKNEEIGVLWTSVSQFQQADAESWPKLSALFKGDKSLTTINGEDYALLAQKESQDAHFLLSKDGSCYKEGKLDLVSLFRCSTIVLENLRGHMLKHCWPLEDVETRIEEVMNRSKRVKTLQEDTVQMRATLDDLLSPLFVNVAELRQKLDGCFQLQTSSGCFGLCPPTPLLSLESAPCKSKLESSYHFMVPRRSEVLDVNHFWETTSHSPIQMNVSGISLQQSIPFSRLRQRRTDCTSPPLKSASTSISVSSALDSGCALSRGADSLLQSIEQLNITPKNRSNVASPRRPAFRKSTSFSFDKSLFICDGETSVCEDFVPEEKKQPLFAQSLGKMALSLNTSGIGSPGSFSSTSGKGCDDGNWSRVDSFSIKVPHATVNYNIGRDARSQATRVSVSDLTLNGVGSAEDRLNPSLQDRRAFLKKAKDVSLTPRHRSHSPLVVKLPDGLKSEQTSGAERGIFEHFPEKWSNISKSLSCVDGSSTRPPVSIPFEADSTTCVPSYSRLSPSAIPSVVRTSLSPTAKKDNQNVTEEYTIVGEPNSTLMPQMDTLKNFYASVASLESLLDRMEDGSPYEVTLGTFTSKHSFNSTGEFLLKESPEGSENFVDGRTFLDGKDVLDVKTCEEEPTSRFLPEDSLFKTLTESLVSGELESELLLDSEVDAEIRRESLNISRRDSVLSLSHRLSEASLNLQNGCEAADWPMEEARLLTLKSFAIGSGMKRSQPSGERVDSNLRQSHFICSQR